MMETMDGELSSGNNVSLTHILRSTKLRYCIIGREERIFWSIC